MEYCTPNYLHLQGDWSFYVFICVCGSKKGGWYNVPCIQLWLDQGSLYPASLEPICLVPDWGQCSREFSYSRLITSVVILYTFLDHFSLYCLLLEQAFMKICQLNI